MPKSPIYEVFLSHHSADKPAVEVLARKLRDLGINVFLDGWHLIPGRDWQPALLEALAQSRSCAVFVGSEGLGPWTMQEMYVALDRAAREPGGFAVIPVLLPGARRPQSLPAFLLQKTWVTFARDLEDPEALHCLVCGIRGEPPGPGRPGQGTEVLPTRSRSMAPPREAFVHRSEYDQVVEALLAGDRAGTVGITTALRGAGGFGKTALATEICWDERIRRAFPDGILWTTMGETLDPAGRLSRVRDLLRWWGNEEPPAFETAMTAGARLREVLAGQRVLLVVDDVWRTEDVEPFRGLGPGSALLVTTRDSRTLPPGRLSIEVDAMASQEAVALLGAGLPESADARLGTLASRLGEWPLLLKIVNRQLQDLVAEGLPQHRAVGEIEEALQAEGLTAFDPQDSENRERTVAWSLDRSLQRLSPEERERYSQLAIFPEDLDVPLSVLERLWGLRAYDVRKLCGRLQDLSLLLRLDRTADTIRLHDVIRTFLLRKHEREVPAFHGRLLDAYRPASGRWADLPREEAYLWRYLSFHLAAAGELASFRGLLVDSDYLHAKLEAAGIFALIEDFDAAGDPALHPVREALWLSIQALGENPRELAGQLFGRLTCQEAPFLEDLAAGQREPWLRPRSPSLTRPGVDLLQTLHLQGPGRVTALAAVDWRSILAGATDRVVRLYELGSGRVLRELRGHTGRITSLVLWGEGRVVSGSGDKTLRVWDLASASCLRTLAGHSGWVSALALVEDRRALSASEDRTLRLWDLESGETLRVFEGHAAKVAAVACLDRRRAVSGAADGDLRLWDLASGEMRRSTNLGAGITALSGLEGGLVLAGLSDGTLRLLDPERGEVRLTLAVPAGKTISAVVPLDGERAVSASADGRMHLWSLATGALLRTLESPSGPTDCLAVLDRGRVVSGSEGVVRLWNLEGFLSRQGERAHRVGVSELMTVPQGQTVSGSFDGRLHLWETATGRPLRTIAGLQKEVPPWVEDLDAVFGRSRLSALAFSPADQGSLVAGFGDGTLLTVSLTTGELRETLAQPSGSAVNVILALGEESILTGHADGRVRLWSLGSGGSPRTWRHDEDPILALAWLGEAGLIASASEDSVAVWDLETQDARKTLETKDCAISFFQGGKRVLATSFKGDGASVWDVLSGQLVHRLDGLLTAGVLSDELALSVAGDGGLQLWDLEKGQCLRTFSDPLPGALRAARLLGSRLLIVSAGRVSRVFSLETGRRIADFHLDEPAIALDVCSATGTIVLGDTCGQVHFLGLEEPPLPRAEEGAG